MPAWAAARRASARSSAPQQRPRAGSRGTLPEQHREPDHRLAAPGEQPGGDRGVEAAAHRDRDPGAAHRQRRRHHRAALQRRGRGAAQRGDRAREHRQEARRSRPRGCRRRRRRARCRAPASRGTPIAASTARGLDLPGGAGRADRHRVALEVEADHQLLVADSPGKATLRGVRQARRAGAVHHRAGDRAATPASKRSRSAARRARARRQLARRQVAGDAEADQRRHVGRRGAPPPLLAAAPEQRRERRAPAAPRAPRRRADRGTCGRRASGSRRPARATSTAILPTAWTASQSSGMPRSRQARGDLGDRLQGAELVVGEHQRDERGVGARARRSSRSGSTTPPPVRAPPRVTSRPRRRSAPPAAARDRRVLERRDDEVAAAGAPHQRTPGPPCCWPRCPRR